MPSKPPKYGIKIWSACDARTRYAWNMQIYVGKPADCVPERYQGKRVVLEVTAGFQGHNVTISSPHALGQELLPIKMTVVGTVRRNKPHLPHNQGQGLFFPSKFAFTDTNTCVLMPEGKRRMCS
jgi:hypothetical protein